MLANMYAVKKVKLVNSFENFIEASNREKYFTEVFLRFKRNFACAAASIFRDFQFIA